jgi:hypothetical protein
MRGISLHRKADNLQISGMFPRILNRFGLAFADPL